MNSTFIKNLQPVFNTFTTGILVECASRKVQIVNQRFLDIFGIPATPQQMVGYDCAEAAKQAMNLVKEPELFVADVLDIIAAGKEQKDQIAFADGRYFTRSYHPVFEEDKLCCHVWNYEEVTSLKDKEQELLNQKEFFHKVLDELPADIAIFSPGHRYIYLNKTAVKNEGIRKWMIGKDDYEYCEMRGLDMAIADRRRALFEEAKEMRSAKTWVDEHVGADGIVNYVLRIYYPYINQHDELEFVIGYGVNINQQKRDEHLIEQEKERFRTLISTLNDGVFQMTFDGHIQLYNESFSKVMGLGDWEIPDQYQPEVMVNVHADDKPLLYQAFNTLLETQQPQQGIFRVLHPHTGDISFIEYYIWHRHTATDGDLAAGRLSDVTEREQRQQHMQELITKEKELNNLKSHFIHITSHELRTPLSVIMSSAEILDMYDANDSEVAEMVDTRYMTNGIVREVNRITDILDELLMVGRIESGKIKFEPVQTNAAAYIQKIAEELFMPCNDGRMLTVSIDEGINDIYIDKSLMRHAIVNLVNNAFKYSPGTKSPELSMRREADQLMIAVRDYGIGIPQQDIDNLFSSFYRASNVGNISGTGIGLMVVEHVVKTHNGTISINSKQGEGSVFTVSIPTMHNNSRNEQSR